MDKQLDHQLVMDGEQQVGNERKSDNEQKLAWLEEEVKNLRGNQKPLDGPYWSMPVTKDRGPPADLGQQLPQQDGGPLQDARDAQPEVRCNVPKTLPELKDVTEPQPALRAGDWLSELMPLISNVSEGASAWWTETLQQAHEAFGRWLAASPLDKMSVQPNRKQGC